MESAGHRRVLFLASTLVTGGAERVVEALVGGLPPHGFETGVLCLRGAGEIGEAIASRGVPVRTDLAAFRRDPFIVPRLVSVFRELRPDVVASLDHHDAMLAGAVAARPGGVRRMVLMVHSTGLWGKRGSFRRTDRMVLPSFDRIVALAGSHADYLVEREGVARSRIAIVSNGVDVERFRPAPSAEARGELRDSLSVPSESFVVAVIAALRPEKNHAMFLRAAARVRERCPGAVFLVVGEGSEAGSLRRLAGELDLGESVRFLGRREDVERILAAIDALVLPSHPVVETFPLVVLEGMAAGLPVAATDVGSVREMMVDGEEGYIIPSGDESRLVERLALLAGSRETRARVGEKARERVLRDFTMDRMIKGYVHMLRELVKQ